MSAPAASSSASVREYLTGVGRTLLGLHRAATAAAAHPTVHSCQAAAAALVPLGTPAQLLTEAGKVPDPVLSQLFTGEVTTTVRLITGCTTATSTAALGRVDRELAKRLHQFGIAA